MRFTIKLSLQTATITDFEGGKQSKAMQDTDYDLFTRKGTTQDAEIQNLIKKHPSSFHILFGILKKIISENKLNGIELISISIDEKESEWQKALKEENMSWKQFIVSNTKSENLKTIFKYGSAIPYSVLIDNNMKILTNSHREGL